MRGEGDAAAAQLREIDMPGDEGFTDTDHGTNCYNIMYT